MSYWNGKVAVITGGSAGLGLHFAEELTERGAKLVLVARDRQRLAAAADSLKAKTVSHPENIVTVPADITNAEDVLRLADVIEESFGRVDALFNCAGRSTRGEALATSPEDYRALWELNFLGTVRCTQALAETLIANRGHVVNIGSLASKCASRFLGAYPTSKSPLVSFSQQLRLENAQIHVLLVCPGPIARDDAGVRYNDSSVPDAARKPGGGAKIKGLDPQEIVLRTLRACERRQLELILPSKAKWLFVLSAISPRLGDWLLTKFTS